MKSAKFTEAQNKDDQVKDFDSIGQIVNFAESKKGGGRIARHKIEYPQDIIDKTIDKLKKYYKDLMDNDPTVAQQLENYLKKKQIVEDMKKDRREAEAAGQEEYQLKDEDFIEFKNMLESEKGGDNNESE